MDLLLKFRRNLERWDKPLLQWHRLSRPRVTRHTRLAAFDAEHAKSPQLNALTVGEGLDDTEQETIYHGLRFELRESGLGRDLIYDVGFSDVQLSLCCKSQYSLRGHVPMHVGATSRRHQMYGRLLFPTSLGVQQWRGSIRICGVLVPTHMVSLQVQ